MIKPFLPVSFCAVVLLFPGATFAQANDVVCTQCVNTSDIADFSVSTAKMQGDSVNSGKIKNGEVKTGDMADFSVTTAKLQGDSVTSGKIKNGEVKAGDIASGAVTLDKLDASARIVFAGAGGAPIQFGPNSNVCVNSGQITITVPGPGLIKVDAQAEVYVFAHTSGTTDLIWVFLEAGPDVCGGSFSDGYRVARWSLGAALPTFVLDEWRNTLPVSRTFAVAEGGEYTYYLNGMRSFGTGMAGFEAAGIQALYFPGAN
jgi:hypothetical protein